MPLPPAPTKRAALLAPEAYDAPARPPARALRKPQTDDAQALSAAATRAAGSAAAAQQPDGPRLRTESPQSVEAANTSSYKQNGKVAPQPDAKPRTSRAAGPGKLFVLDTNVLLHDPM
jgi:PhoH-like ATPase